jgi:hypothetical protein
MFGRWTRSRDWRSAPTPPYNCAVDDEVKQTVTPLYRLARLEELIESHFKRLYDLVRACAETVNEGITGEAHRPHALSVLEVSDPVHEYGLTVTFDLLFRGRSIVEFRCIQGRSPEPRLVIGSCQLTITETRERVATLHLTKRNGDADWDINLDDDSPPSPISRDFILTVLRVYADSALKKYGVAPPAETREQKWRI